MTKARYVTVSVSQRCTKSMYPFFPTLFLKRLRLRKDVAEVSSKYPGDDVPGDDVYSGEPSLIQESVNTLTNPELGI